MGGCGGTHGEAGKGGGASVALLIWDSGVTLDTIALVSATGGKGGKGGDSGGAGAGAKGGSGGGSFLGSPHIGAAGDGGKGGDGGNGGSGSGGTGGPSVPLVFRGIAPAGSPTFIQGMLGPKGAGGSLNNSPASKAPDGTDGMKQAVYEQK
jgi:hypothetical protein